MSKLTFEAFYEQVRGRDKDGQDAYITKVRLSAETLLAMLRNPGEKTCFYAFGIRIELDETMPPDEFRLVTAREELGLPPAPPK